MKPISEEELFIAASNAWAEFAQQEGIYYPSFIYGFKHGYAKCVEQMQNEFNELLEACHIALQNQTNVDINEIIHQMKGGEQ